MKKLFVLFVLGAAAMACGGEAPKATDPTTSTSAPADATKATDTAAKNAPAAPASGAPATETAPAKK